MNTQWLENSKWYLMDKRGGLNASLSPWATIAEASEEDTKSHLEFSNFFGWRECANSKGR